MEHIRITANKLIQDWQDKQHIHKEAILKDGLKRVLTHQEQRHIKYCSVKDSRVTLGVDSSAWFYMLHLKKRQLLRHLNKVLDVKGDITDILLRLDTRCRHRR